MGYQITRYSGAAFKVDVLEADGSVRGLDVFGGFLADGHLHLMGEIRTPFRREWIFPLGTTTLEGRAAAGPGEHRRVPHRDLRPELAGARPGVQVRDAGLDAPPAQRLVPRHPREAGELGPHLLAAARPRRRPSSRPPSRPGCAAQERGVPARVVDIGCGRGVDDLWFARQGASVVGLDYALRGSEAVAGLAADEEVDLEFRHAEPLRAPLGARRERPASRGCPAAPWSPPGTSPTPPTGSDAATCGGRAR